MSRNTQHERKGSPRKHLNQALNNSAIIYFCLGLSFGKPDSVQVGFKSI